ncbi:DNA-binding response OmpR family regulator [Sinorhizobium fredii]
MRWNSCPSPAFPGIAMGLQRSKAREPVTIMLVEEEEPLLFEFEEALTEAGVNVVACSSGTKDVEYLRSAEGAAEGVVTDIRLRTGPSTVGRWRALPGRSTRR